MAPTSGVSSSTSTRRPWRPSASAATRPPRPAPAIRIGMPCAGKGHHPEARCNHGRLYGFTFRGDGRMNANRFLFLLDRSLGAVLGAGRWLIVPIVVLLFLQWPLRDLLRVYSREANDLGQWIFALYVAASVTAATRERMHLAADLIARNYG